MSSSAAPAQGPSKHRITVGNYFADIVVGEGHGLQVFHWLLHRVGSPQILMWGQELTHEAACASAQTYLQHLAGKDTIQSSN